jgi:hypothetical protein
MADSLTSVVKAGISGSYQDTVGTAETVAVEFALNLSNSLADGTSASQADKVWFANNRTLTGTTPEDLDVFDLAAFDIGPGAGKGPLGGTYANVELVALLIRNDTTSTGNIIIGGKNAGTAFNSFLAVAGVADDTAQVGPIHPGGWFMIHSPANPAYAIADTTNHLLTITPTANATYDIYMLTRSA